MTKIIPSSCEFSSPVRPFERFTSKIFLLSIISRRLKPLFVWPIILRIISFERKAPNLLTNQPSTSDLFASLVCAISLFQKSSTVRSVMYFIFSSVNDWSLNTCGTSINVEPFGSLMIVRAALRNQCSYRGPIIPV
ncbi:hypothetical protein D3C79_676990 [compost metagenome]